MFVYKPKRGNRENFRFYHIKIGRNRWGGFHSVLARIVLGLGICAAGRIWILPPMALWGIVYVPVRSCRVRPVDPYPRPHQTQLAVV